MMKENQIRRLFRATTAVEPESIIAGVANLSSGMTSAVSVLGLQAFVVGLV
jgi:hypothetical protein